MQTQENAIPDPLCLPNRRFSTGDRITVRMLLDKDLERAPGLSLASPPGLALIHEFCSTF
jgi:hypothetical protein